MKRILIFCASLAIVSGIYDGNDATRHQFPYLVYVVSPQFYCAGTLISDRHVLTAAHCLMSLRGSQKAKIILGMHYNGWNKDGVQVWSKNHWIHENFSMPLAMYDIGLAELPDSIDKLVNSSRYAKPIKIDPTPNVDLDLNQKEVIVSGWGHTSRYHPAYVPQYTKMNLISISECLPYQSHYIETITPDHICTENVQGTPCDGDSGAAIISTKTNKIIGVLSYVKDAENFTDMGYNDCKTKVPVVSTRISSFIDWIHSKIGIDFSIPEKTCKGLGDVNATNIHRYEGCEIIDGSLEINGNTFKAMNPDKLKVFKSVRKITGQLLVYGYHQNFTDLSYFENLESLNEKGLDNSLGLGIYQTSLKSLGLISLKKIHNGKILIAFNENLCYAVNIDWSKILSDDRNVTVGRNRNTTECEYDGEICSTECLSSGCWGKNEIECLEIGRKSDLSNEIENSSGDDGFWK